MTRSLAICFGKFLLHGATIAAILLALATIGCQQSEPPKSKQTGGESAPSAEKGQKPTTSAKGPTAHEVLDRMVAAYRKASSYVDVGSVRFSVEAGGKTVQNQTEDFSFAYVAPNKVRIRSYKTELVSDGKTIYAYCRNIPGQVFSRPAPDRIEIRHIQPDVMINRGMMHPIAGNLPQVFLLFEKEPLKELLKAIGEPTLAEPGQIAGRDCYRLEFKGNAGVTTFWIDQKTNVLRRAVLPTDALRQEIGQGGQIDNVSVVAEFSGAELNGDVDPKAFEFEVPKDVAIVEFITPPHMGQLLNKKVPDFKFTDVAGKAVTPETTAGKTTVFAFWSIRFPQCQEMLKQLDQVVQKYKNNPKVAIYAVCCDPIQFTNSEMEKTLTELTVTVPSARGDLDVVGAAFHLGEPPTTFIINDKGIVQHWEGGLNPKYADSLKTNLDKVLAGEDIYQEPLKQYLEQVEGLRKFAESTKHEAPEPKTGDAAIIKEEPLPKTEIAPRSQPRVLKLAPAWKCPELKMPGNMLVIDGPKGPERLLVIENAAAVAEVGLDGKLIAMHALELADKEVVGNLRTAVDAEGHRFYAAFMVSNQRCHVFDENWKLIAHYPQDALEHPHSGISDVQLGDLDGDGKVKMYVSYMGVVGVQAVSLDGNRIWKNRTTVSSVACLALAPANTTKQGNLYCANFPNTLVTLDAKGERVTDVKVGNEPVFRIVRADLRNDGNPLWCGLSLRELGKVTAIGFTLAGDALWSYPLPIGVSPQPIEPILTGRVTREGPGQWLLPGPDGSIHILSADGKPFDNFNYGAALQGLATFEIAGQPILVVGSPNGLEAWKVD